MYVILGGTFKGGYCLYGPFDSEALAEEWANGHGFHDTVWEVVPLWPPVD